MVRQFMPIGIKTGLFDKFQRAAIAIRPHFFGHLFIPKLAIFVLEDYTFNPAFAIIFFPNGLTFPENPNLIAVNGVVNRNHLTVWNELIPNSHNHFIGLYDFALDELFFVLVVNYVGHVSKIVILSIVYRIFSSDYILGMETELEYNELPNPVTQDIEASKVEDAEEIPEDKIMEDIEPDLAYLMADY